MSVSSQPPAKSPFQALCRHQVNDHHTQQDQEKERGQRDKTRISGNRRKWKCGGQDGNRKGKDDKPQVVTTLERIAPGTDDEDDQYLRGHRFDEPAVVKKRFAGMEEHQHYLEREEVEDRADRPDR
jgi:hypothetical protein